MKTVERVRQALPISIGVHAIVLTISTLPSWRGAQELRAITHEHPRGDRLLDMAGGDSWLEIATRLSDAHTNFLWALGPMALLLLLAPAIFISWAHSIRAGSERGPLSSVLRFGIEHYKSSALITLGIAPLAALSLAGVGYGIFAGFSFSPLRIPYTLACTGLCVGIVIGLFANLIHDLLRVAIVLQLPKRRERLTASWFALRSVRTWRDFVIYRLGDSTLLAGVLYILAMPYVDSYWGGAIQMLLPQGLLLLRTLLRSWWIAALLQSLHLPTR